MLGPVMGMYQGSQTFWLIPTACPSEDFTALVNCKAGVSGHIYVLAGRGDGGYVLLAL